jgi:hypothetical protein
MEKLSPQGLVVRGHFLELSQNIVPRSCFLLALALFGLFNEVIHVFEHPYFGFRCLDAADKELERTKA